MNRRQVLKSFASLPLLSLGTGLAGKAAAQLSTQVSIGAEVRAAQIGNKSTDQAWSYGQSYLSGQPLRLPLGQPVQIQASNRLPEPTSVHWHGLRVPSDMDGSSAMLENQGAHLIAPGSDRAYIFTPKDPGLYWFHAHNRSWNQVGRGLYGALLVHDGDQTEVDDHILLLDDWPTRWGGLQFSQLGNAHDWSHGGHMGGLSTVNGKEHENIGFLRGKPLRLRFLNTATARIFTPNISPAANVAAQVIAIDGYDIEPQIISENWFALGPGQRTDILLDTSTLSNGAQLALSGGPTLRFEETGQVPNAIPLADVLANHDAYMPPELMPERPNQTHELLMAGGAMGGMGMMGDGKFWAFGARGQRADRPLFSGRVGETIQVNLSNDTRWNHTIHWHGQHALVQQSNRLLEATPTLRDGVTLTPGERTQVQFRLAESGQWLLHCHMLGHQASGMSTWFETFA